MKAKQAKGMLGQIGDKMQSMREARRPPPRKRAKGALGQIGDKMREAKQRRSTPRKRARGTLGQIGEQMQARQTDLRKSFGSF